MFNLIRTGVLIAALTALFMAVGYFIGGQTGMFIAFVVAAGDEPLRLLERRQDGAFDAGRRRGRSRAGRPISTAWSRR